MSGFKDRMRSGRPGRGGPRDDAGDRRGHAGPGAAGPGAAGPRDAGPRDDRGPARGARPDARNGFRADQRGGFRADVRRDAGPRDAPRDAAPRDAAPRPARDDRPRTKRDDRGPRGDGSRVSQSEDGDRDAREEKPKPPRINGPGERVVYGAGPVREVITRNAKSVRAIWVDPRRADKSVGDPVAQAVISARQANILVDDRERDHLDRAAEGGRHQGVVAWLGPFEYASLDDLILPTEPAMLVALDGVEDPRNLGAILRSAYLLGAHGVIIPEHRAAQVTPLVSKTSAGASELLPIALVPNLVRALEELREKNVWRVAVHAAPDAKPIASIDGKMAHVLVLGSEGNGVRPLVAKHCDFHAIIPMIRDGVGSFNVSVAAALALYELRRQRL